MTNKRRISNGSKISPEFRTRLSRLGSKQKIRVILILQIKDTGGASSREHSPVSRQSAVEAIRKSAEPALVDIDDILKDFDGERLAAQIDALGSVPVETTPAGIAALAASKHVKTILEDQSISLIH
jgi:hypothetical protein